ncbi:MAG: OstA-like protein [Bacteroidia bacterium]
MRLYLSFLFIFTVKIFFSQKKIEIIHADALKYNKFIDANRLLGNVVCKHESTLFYCDSMYLYSNQSLRAFGNIRIVSDSLIITSENLFYDASTKLATLEKNVQCSDNQIRLTTEILQFHTQEHYAYYPSKALIIRKDMQLSSRQGYYYSKNKTLAFKNEVELQSPDYTIKTDTLFYYTITDIAHFNAPTIILMNKDYLYCEKGWYDTKNKKAYFSKNPMLFSDNKKLYADSLYYDEVKNTGYAYNHIRMIDSSQTNIIYGNYGVYDRMNEKAMITQHPVWIHYNETLENDQAHTKDTILITCDTMHYEKPDSHVVVKCIHHSRLYHPQFQASSENILYNEKDSAIHFIQSPKCWFQKNQAKSRKITLYLKNKSIDKIALDSNVIIMQEADTIYHNKFNQIAGRKMNVYFRKDSIQSINVDGNAQVYYFLKNEAGQWTGLNKAKCSKIQVHFQNNEIFKISFIDNPESILIPIKKIQPEKERLPDFQWEPHLRPKRNEMY